ncbi:MAG: hypothetical protein LBV66_00645 [Elusimicrobiota bacterium]|jgi:superoxide reductase|nr:hypothetical protein [Elusimicrobiota bacterium]
MKNFVCKVCGFVSLEGNLEKCPVCGLPKVFEEKENAYKTPDFKSDSGESEKKHIPQISIHENCELIEGSNAVRVRVGEIVHPMTEEHSITEVFFYINNKFVAAASLTPKVLPTAFIVIKNDIKGKIQVIENCNLHGKWYNEVEVK